MVKGKNTEKPFVAKKFRKGKAYYYFRKDEKYTRLPDNPDSPEFDKEYWALRSGHKKSASKTTFGELIASYYQSPKFEKLADSTKAEYRRTLEVLREKNGEKDFTKLRRKHVIEARDHYAETWRKANAIVETISILARHAIELEWITSNPAATVEKLSGGTYEPWPDVVQKAFVSCCENQGNFLALTAYHLCTGTGQRIGDVVKMRWDQFDGDFVDVVQEKTGAHVTIYCPLRLRKYLNQLSKEGDYILAKNLRQHIAKRQVQNAVMEIRKIIDAQKYVIHGWRYTAAVELAEAGCSDAEIQSVTGHKSLEMVRKYRSKANQKRTSKQAQERREQNKNKP